MGRPTLYSTPGIKGLRQTTRPTKRQPYRPGVTEFWADFRVRKKRTIQPLGKDLERARRQLQKLREAATGPKPTLGQLRLSDAQERELQSRHEPLRPNTLAKYQQADRLAREWLGDPWLNKLTAANVREYLAHRSELVGAETYNRDLKRLRAVLAWAVSEGVIASNPCQGIREQRTPKKLVRYLTQEEQGRLKAVCDPYLWQMIRFAMLTGLRISEQLGLEWSQVVDGQIRLRADQTKEKRPRVIPFGDPVAEILAALPRVSDLVFPSPKGLPWDRNNFAEDRWRPARKAAGIENFRWHDLRHTFASRLVMAGQSLYTVAELMGHVSIKTTTKYAHLSPEHLRQAVGVLE